MLKVYIYNLCFFGPCAFFFGKAMWGSWLTGNMIGAAGYGTVAGIAVIGAIFFIDYFRKKHD